MIEDKKTLLLNSNYEPLSFITCYEALTLFFKDKIDIIEKWNDEQIHTVSKAYDIPSVVKLKHYVRRPNMTPRFSRLALFDRDNWTCAYCSRNVIYDNATVDHIVPRCKGGRTTWQNCATACKFCNRKKADLSLSETGMILKIIPKIPNAYNLMNRFNYTPNPEWQNYFNS